MAAILLIQVFSSYAHNQLRFCLLTHSTFSGTAVLNWTADTLAAVSTMMIVLPFFILSIPAGRSADKWSKSTIIKRTKLVQLLIFFIVAVSLWLDMMFIVLVCLLLCGVEAAFFGPAKFAIIPELVPRERLVAANGLLSAANLVGILIGMVAGSVLGLSAEGVYLTGGLGLLAAGLSFLASRFLSYVPPMAPYLSMHPVVVLKDIPTSFGRVLGVPGIVSPIIGANWFWFQGALTTTLLPLYVQQSSGFSDEVVALMLVSTTLGVVAGALICRWLTWRRMSASLPLVLILVIMLPAFDIWALGHPASHVELVRVLVDLFVASAGTGLFLVPLNTMIQALSAESERSRLIGVSNALGGLAMLTSGAAILLLGWLGFHVVDIFLINALGTGVVAAICMLRTLPRLVSYLNET